MIKKLVYCLLGLALVAVFVQGCSQNKKGTGENGKLTVTDTLPSPDHNITIRGVTDDSKAFDYLNVINYSYFNGTNHYGISKEMIDDSVKFTLPVIDRPQIMELFAFGDSTYYNTRFFVSPGDEILLSIHNKGIHFKGKNAAHYNFYKELDSTNTEWAENKYSGNLKDYKDRCRSIYQKRQVFFKDYIARNQVSDDFVKQISAELEFEYLFNLIAPRSIPSETGGNVNDGDFMALTTTANEVEEQGVFDLKEYLGPITIDDFQRPELVNNDYFKRCLVSFIRYYFTSHDFVNYSREDFRSEQKYIEDNLEGEIKEYALTKLIVDYYEKGFGLGSSDNQLVKEFLKEQKGKISNPSYREALIRIEEDLSLKGFNLAEKIVGDRLTTLNNDTVPMADILKKTKNKIKVLDFWTSWCSPCISEIKKTVTFRNELAVRNNVAWIFVSIDKDENKWKNRSKELKHLLNSENQYRLLNTDNRSGLLQFLTNGKSATFMVPRYVIIDSNDEVILSQAPRPTDSLVFRDVIEKIKNNGQTYR